MTGPPSIQAIVAEQISREPVTAGRLGKPGQPGLPHAYFPRSVSTGLFALRVPLLLIGIGLTLAVVFALLVALLSGVFAGPVATKAIAPATPTSTVTTTATAGGVASAGVVPPGSCSGATVTLADQFFPDVVQGGNGTPPTFSTNGKRYCLIQITTYHWNDGKGDPPGPTDTLGVVDAGGRELGRWHVVGTPGTGGTISGWEASVPYTPTPVVLDGTYTVIDSRQATWSWSKASGGKGFIRVYAYPYVTQ